MTSNSLDSIFVQTLDMGTGGLTVAVKDSIDIAGYPTRAGSATLADASPAMSHADVVRALLDAGCHIVGKTNLHELAYGVTGINHWTGTPVNPRFPDRVPGGSSSGSAVAVAAGLVDMAIGTDTGGSIRIPATCCAVYGIKPTFGRISRRGVHPAASSLDCVGVFTRNMAMLETAMSILDAGFHPAPLPTRARLAVLDVSAKTEVMATVRAALDDSGFSLTAAALPLGHAFDAALAIIGAETWAAFGSLTNRGAMGSDVRARLLAAREISRDQVDAAEQVRLRFKAEVDLLLDDADALALPTMPDFPLTLTAAADARAGISTTALVRPFNLSGHPAVTIPLLAPGGLPVGLQLIGRMGEDAALCALARHVSSAGRAVVRAE
jgi:amidase